MRPESFFDNGHAVDLVLAVLAVEFIVLVARDAKQGRRAAVVDLFFAMSPGACLLLALRAALTGASWPWIAAFLTASFPVHIADLVRRRR